MPATEATAAIPVPVLDTVIQRLERAEPRRTPRLRAYAGAERGPVRGRIMTIVTGVLSDRDLGWLRYLHRKATTPDRLGPRRAPAPHWDDVSDPPMLCWHRFDLIDSTYAVALMADRTPAWREVYGRILDELIFRHTGGGRPRTGSPRSATTPTARTTPTCTGS